MDTKSQIEQKIAEIDQRLKPAQDLVDQLVRQIRVLREAQAILEPHSGVPDVINTSTETEPKPSHERPFITYKASVAKELLEYGRFIGSMGLTRRLHPDGTDLDKKRTNISGILSDYKEDAESGIISRGAGKSTLWGYKEWLNEDGTVKPEHKALI